MDQHLEILLDKARGAADAACKISSEVLDVSRMKLEECRLKAELRSAYEVLGRCCYDSLTKGADNSETVKRCTNRIAQLRDSLAELRRALCVCDDIEEVITGKPRRIFDES